MLAFSKDVSNCFTPGGREPPKSTILCPGMSKAHGTFYRPKVFPFKSTIINTVLHEYSYKFLCTYISLELQRRKCQFLT